MRTVSVSNLDLFRVWRDDEELGVEWLLRKLRGEEPQTEAMMAGEAFHKILEAPDFEEQTELACNGFEFSVLCEVELVLPSVRELRIEKKYGDLLVRGRVDGITGTTVTDYKTTAQFDPERLLEGYQWRLYLDMTDCNSFDWKVFVLNERKERRYDVTQTHDLSQCRYTDLRTDCERLAADYLEFISQFPEALTTRPARSEAPARTNAAQGSAYAVPRAVIPNTPI